jgi:hypothetical protein
VTDNMPALVPYFRRVIGAGFSLQANTPASPLPGHFYLFQGDQVVCDSEDFAVVEAEYKLLCRAHWDAHLDSADPAERKASAWGLLGLDVRHPAATREIEQGGTPADQKRLQQMRNRARLPCAARARARDDPGRLFR